MIKILSGEMAIELHLQFLIRNNNTDLMILKNTKVGQNRPADLSNNIRIVECQTHCFKNLVSFLVYLLFLYVLGCSAKFSVPHGDSHSKLIHAHGNDK